MKFGEVSVHDSLGCYLAHSVKTATGKIRKGQQLNEALVAQLLESDLTRVTVAQLEPDDVHEDEAASLLARAIAGGGIRIGKASTGRVNLHAQVDGLCDFDRNHIDRANAVDEGITIATVEPSSVVGKGRLLATVKIIPYAVSRQSLEMVLADLQQNLQVHAALPHQAVLIQTQLPTLKPSVLDKTVTVTRQRLLAHHAQLLDERRVPHNIDELVESIESALQLQPDWLLVAGASAIADRRDVIPAAITRLGGQIHHFGMPMDPGNLLLLGSIGKTWVLGMPGCARSPRPNGLDKVLERLACDLPVSSSWVSSLGVGGLLHEIVDRPEPREAVSRKHEVAALVLAAGSSRRFGEGNKLLAKRKTEPLLSSVLTCVQQSEVTRALLVTGHESERIVQGGEAAWLSESLPLSFVHNPLYATGMASSLVKGVAELSALGMDAALVCLADMPEVTPELMNQLIKAFRQNPMKALYIPTFDGRRGNPVLIAASLFDSVLKLEGDVGARVLARTFPESVMEVPCDVPGVLLDIDTPEELQNSESPSD